MKIGANSSIRQHQYHVGSTKVKGKTSTTHKNMVEATQKGNVALVESINHIHEINLRIEENHACA
jgi:hypothetical protein